jgi:NitT/TauT family transport system ATP-binding protein
MDARVKPAHDDWGKQMTSEVAIRIKDVSHQFGEEGDARHVVALRHTSLDVARGELLCLIGPSGCGKSTLLNVIGGLMDPTTGTVEVAGKPVRGPMPHDIAFVFQENALFPWNTVFENINLGMVFQGVPRGERETRARRSLEAVGLKDFAQHYPGQLSGGMRQRAALARALSLETGILLMDEPFGALDEQTRMILGEDLSVLLSRTDKTIVFVTHSLGEATFLADRVAVFSARPGTIKEIIPVDEPHPRKPDFVTSEKFTTVRNELYRLLHDEIRKTMAETGVTATLASEASDQRGNSIVRAHSASEDARERADDTRPEPGSSARDAPGSAL